MIYAIIDTNTNTVLNRVEYDDVPTTPPPGYGDGVIAVAHERADDTWVWNGSELVAPIIEPVPDPALVRALTVSQIMALEYSQSRPLRELALGDQTALKRLQEIETSIAALRATL